MSCYCPSPSPSIICNAPYDPSLIQPMVKMYLGERVDPDTGALSLYTSSVEDFVIPYSLSPLIDAGVLPDTTPTIFNLTERELLASASYETWITYTVDMTVCNQDTFATHVFTALGVDMTDWADWCVKNTARLTNGEAIDIGNFSSYFRWRPELSISTEERNLLESKIILCYQWFREIYDNFYGKTYLVKIGETTSNPSYGICIKDKTGNDPIRTKPFIVHGDGSDQGLYLSDEVSSDGGMMPNYAVNPIPILGLDLANDSEIFRTDDGKLDCFVRFATIAKNSNPSVADINENIIIEKFDRQYVVDISKLSPENYVIGTRLYQPNGFTYSHTKNLFIKATADTKIYVDDDGQWVPVRLAQLVPLSPLKSRGNYRWSVDMTLSIFSNSFREIFEKSINSVGNAVQVVAHGEKTGALNNSSQLNTLIPSDMTVFPEAFAIPMKSNILRYGPYISAGGDNTGGVEVSVEDFLAPWNFMTSPVSGLYPYSVQSAYTDMNDVGQQLADDGIKNNLSIENGTITVAGIPQYNLAFQPANNILINQKLGPQALLSDISVTYGASGFTTTYNFATFSPRFGQPGKYLIDRWSDSIKEIQAVNRYLREERQKVHNISNTLKQNFAEKQIGSRSADRQLIDGPKGKTSASPNRFIYSGYFLAEGVAPSIPPYEPEAILDINPAMPPCYPCSNAPSVSPISSPDPPPTDKPSTEYVFAETHTGYTDQYIQDTYYQLAIMSLDGHYLPVSLKGSPKQPPLPSSSPGVGLTITDCLNDEWDVLLPRFAMRLDDNGEYIDFNDMNFGNNGLAGYPVYNQSRYCMPPFMLDIENDPKDINVNLMPITQQYLNPILSTELMTFWDDRKNDSENGFVVCSIAFGCKFTDFELTFGTPDSDRQSQDNFRFSALRGPLVLQGWGYDTNGKPIPNEYDDPLRVMEGKFKRTGLSDKFMKEWISAPKTWPVGPVDLRFDRERGVWTAPSQNKIIVARLKDKLTPFGSAKAELINPTADGLHFYENFDISGPNGENIKESITKASITVYDFIGMNLCECDIVYAYFDDNRYIVLESSRKGDKSVCPPCSTPITPSPSPSPSASPCWCDLECLKTLKGYDACKRQALIHYDGCLTWEDIVQCDPIQNSIEQAKYEECQVDHPPPWTDYGSSY